jgi:hypothetical protein
MDNVYVFSSHCNDEVHSLWITRIMLVPQAVIRNSATSKGDFRLSR